MPGLYSDRFKTALSLLPPADSPPSVPPRPNHLLHLRRAGGGGGGGDHLGDGGLFHVPTGEGEARKRGGRRGGEGLDGWREGMVVQWRDVGESAHSARARSSTQTEHINQHEHVLIRSLTHFYRNV